jgi:hypothetical protein
MRNRFFSKHWRAAPRETGREPADLDVWEGEGGSCGEGAAGPRPLFFGEDPHAPDGDPAPARRAPRPQGRWLGLLAVAAGFLVLAQRRRAGSRG